MKNGWVARRRREAIGDHVVEPVRAPSVPRIAEPVQLHGRGPQREDLAARVRGVAVEIDQHCDAIRANALRDRLRRVATEIGEMLERAGDAPAERPIARQQSVGERFHAAIEPLEQSISASDRMLPKVRRHESDAQALSRRRQVSCFGQAPGGHRCRDLPRQSACRKRTRSPGRAASRAAETERDCPPRLASLR